MSILAQHLTAVLVHYVQNDQGGKVSLFASDISDVLLARYDIRAPDSLISDAMAILTELGGCRNLESPLTGTFCQLDASAAGYYFGGWPSFATEWGPDEEAGDAYGLKREAIHKKYPILETFFESDRPWIERIISTLAGMDLAADDQPQIASSASPAVPASDRIVSLQDNQPEVAQLRASARDLKEAIDGANDLGELTPEEAMIAASEVEQLGDLLEQPAVRSGTVTSLAQRTLRWIGEKAAGAAIGKAALALLALIASFFGISL